MITGSSDWEKGGEHNIAPECFVFFETVNLSTHFSPALSCGIVYSHDYYYYCTFQMAAGEICCSCVARDLLP